MGNQGRRVGVVINPTAGKGQAAVTVPGLMDDLRARGHDLVDLSGDSAGIALSRARAAVTAGTIDVLAVAGGDGMVHLGVNACAGTDVPLAIIPLGTGNDLANALGLAVGDLNAATTMIDAGRVRRIDAVRRPEDVSRPWFGGVLCGGFDSIVNARANLWRWPRGQMRYNLAVLRELPTFRSIPYVLEIDGNRITTSAMLVIVANGPSYGGGMKVAPDAKLDDGLLDVIILHEIKRAELLKVFPSVFSGAHVDHPAVEMHRARHVHLAAKGITAFADGEPFAPLPLTCEVVPGALQVIVP